MLKMKGQDSMASVEEKAEDFYKEQLKGYKVRCFGKTESMNTDIDNALNRILHNLVEQNPKKVMEDRVLELMKIQGLYAEINMQGGTGTIYQKSIIL